MRNFSDVSLDEIEGLAALQDSDGLVVGQTMKGTAVTFEDFVTELKKKNF